MVAATDSASAGDRGEGKIALGERARAGVTDFGDGARLSLSRSAKVFFETHGAGPLGGVGLFMLSLPASRPPRQRRFRAASLQAISESFLINDPRPHFLRKE
jgi:hypothetical protein